LSEGKSRTAGGRRGRRRPRGGRVPLVGKAGCAVSAAVFPTDGLAPVWFPLPKSAVRPWWLCGLGFARA